MNEGYRALTKDSASIMEVADTVFIINGDTRVCIKSRYANLLVGGKYTESFVAQYAKIARNVVIVREA